MKKTTLVRALVLASLAIAAKGYSQNVVPGSVSKVNFAFTVSSSVASAKKIDQETGKPVKPTTLVESQEYFTEKNGVKTTTVETGTKIVTAKYSNKEILTDLLKATKNIDDIKGWYIEKIQVSTEIAEGEIGDPVFYLSHKDQDSIAVGNRIAFDVYAKISGETRKDITTSTEAPGEGEGAPPVVTVTGSKTTYSEAIKLGGELSINLTPEAVEGAPAPIAKGFELGGVYTGTQKLGALKDTAKTPVVISGAGKINSISGVTFDDKIVEGSVTFAAGVAADVAGYEDILPSVQ